jgi:hypothetical protein
LENSDAKRIKARRKARRTPARYAKQENSAQKCTRRRCREPGNFATRVLVGHHEGSQRIFRASYQGRPGNAALVHAKPGSARPGDPAGPAKLIDGIGAFTIDNAVAKALRDDYHRLGELERKKCGDPLSAAEVEEESKLRARIGDRARAIVCPAGYGLKQAQKDGYRLHQLYCKRISPPPCGGGALPEAEDAEEAQLRARVAAFDESPEGCARHRIRDLEMQDVRGGRSAAEQNELDRLRTLYPDLPLDPDNPLTEAFEAWRRVAAE